LPEIKRRKAHQAAQELYGGHLDDMMAELHLLRAVLSIARRDTTIEEILSQTVTS
jgi:hypothetical protein